MSSHHSLLSGHQHLEYDVAFVFLWRILDMNPTTLLAMNAIRCWPGMVVEYEHGRGVCGLLPLP
jgi:hypothetical protein